MIKWLKQLFLRKNKREEHLSKPQSPEHQNPVYVLPSSQANHLNSPSIQMPALYETVQETEYHSGIFTKDRLELNEEQAAIYHQLEKSNQNYFVTGKAGTGKSVLLQAFVFNTDKKIAVLAPTGVAAIHVGGQTIHSFFGLGVNFQDTKNSKHVHQNLSGNRIHMLRMVNTIVIDEFSMVRVDVMDMIDRKLQAARENALPFGGCQIIAFGDLFQLPPVISSSDEGLSELLYSRYQSIYFFGAPAFIRKPPTRLVAARNPYVNLARITYVTNMQ